MKKGRFCVLLLAVLLVLLVVLAPAASDRVLCLLYPRPFSELVRREALEFALEEELLYAVMKVESGFDQQARSRAGACGLMQLTPPTFEWMASQHPPENGGRDLFDPGDNIHCASALLRRLLDHYGSLEVALAAYNAGMGNVSGWLQEGRYSHDGKSLDVIPYPETEAYVKKVSRCYAIYRELYREDDG